MPPQHKAEALRALASIGAKLAGPGPLDPIETVQLRALVEYAQQEVEQIQEVKKVRRSAPGVAAVMPESGPPAVEKSAP